MNEKKRRCLFAVSSLVACVRAGFGTTPIRRKPSASPRATRGVVTFLSSSVGTEPVTGSVSTTHSVEGVDERSSSRALRSILGEESTDEDFFQNVWQKSCRVYRSNTDRSSESLDESDPLHGQVTMGVDGLVKLMECAGGKFLEPPGPDWTKTLPMVFDRNKNALQLPEVASRYGGDLFRAYLDGCSVVMNHADQLCPNTAALCEDLQKSFPFAYANAYLTPPASQAVRAHADDRDVLVIQVYGQKAWKVYEEIPIEYPYPHEQVGKELPVPPSVLEGPRSVDTLLQPGDVLYIPRGHVHEACTHKLNEEKEQHPSFHVTIALATFDWALTGVLANALRHTLDAQPEFRMAVPLEFGMQNIDTISTEQKRALEEQVENALERVRRQVTVDYISNAMRQKHQYHTQRARPGREKRIALAEKSPHPASDADTGSAIVGATAANALTLSTTVRIATPEETVPGVDATSPRLREETADSLLFMLEALREGPVRECSISELPNLLNYTCDFICDLTLLSFAKKCVERGQLAIALS